MKIFPFYLAIFPFLQDKLHKSHETKVTNYYIFVIVVKDSPIGPCTKPSFPCFSNWTGMYPIRLSSTVRADASFLSVVKMSLRQRQTLHLTNELIK